MRAKNPSERSRGKFLREAPKKLRQLIELVNLLPPDLSAQSDMHPESVKAEVRAVVNDPSYQVSERWLRMTAGFEDEYPPSIWESAKLIHERIKHLSPELHSYVFTSGMTEDNIRARATLPEESPILRYENLWYSAARLRKIARRAKERLTKSVGVFNLNPTSTLLPMMDEIDSYGFVRVHKDLFTEAVEEEKVEAARIRECAVCKRIFWAGRNDAQQCGLAKCKSALSSRLNRNPELRELYNKARRTKRRKQREAKKQDYSKQRKGK